MITYDEALEIARMRKENADTCIEFESAYVSTTKEMQIMLVDMDIVQ